MDNTLFIVGVIILGLSMLITFTALLIAIIYDKSQDAKAKKQHLMLNQLKKGDFVWKVTDGFLTRYKVSGVEYHFDSNDNVYKITISFVGEYHKLNIPMKIAKAFVYDEFTAKYYTIYKEAEIVTNLTEMRRKKAIENAQSVDASEVASKLNEEIKVFEKLRDDTIERLTVELDK
jgi:preprotein translocase subunit YajC